MGPCPAPAGDAARHRLFVRLPEGWGLSRTLHAAAPVSPFKIVHRGCGCRWGCPLPGAVTAAATARNHGGLHEAEGREGRSSGFHGGL
jgi:hypothetical protein